MSDDMDPLDPREVAKQMYGFSEDQVDEIIGKIDLTHDMFSAISVQMLQQIEMNEALFGLGSGPTPEERQAVISASTSILMQLIAYASSSCGPLFAQELLEMLQHLAVEHAGWEPSDD